MLKEFREFAVKGNLLEIAVGLILGLAFSAVVTAFVDGVVMNLIAALVGQPSFDSIVWTIGEGADATTILIGAFLTAVVNFLLVAFVLFMFVKALRRMERRQPDVVIQPSEEIVLLREIRDAVRRS